MSLLNLLAISDIERSVYGRTPSDFHKAAFFAQNRSEWANAPNLAGRAGVPPMFRETAYGSFEFEETACRIDGVVADSATGANKGDDFKGFIFEPWTKSVFLGEMYKWNENFWLCVNSNSAGTLGNSATARRCNAVFRVLDGAGQTRKIPACLDLSHKQASDWNAKAIFVANGFTRGIVRKDALSALIKPNTRIVLGQPENRFVVRVTGFGVYNAYNSVTENDDSPGLIELWLAADETSAAADDLTASVANAFTPFQENFNGNINIFPNVKFVLEGRETVFEVSAANVDGAPVLAFLFEDVSDERAKGGYEFKILDERRFAVKNLRRNDFAGVSVKCSCEVGGENIDRKFEFMLKGAF